MRLVERLDSDSLHADIWNVNGWGNTDRLLLDKRATKKKMPAMNGASGFRIWL
jgi:hypothetical protein